VVDAVRCAIEVQNGMVERNAGLPPERCITFRIGVHSGDVVEESDGDLMGDGVNIAARLEGIAEPGGVCLSEDAYRQVRGKISEAFDDLGIQHLKNIEQPVRAYRVILDHGAAQSAPAVAALPEGNLALPDKPSIAVLPFQNMSGDPEQEYFADGMVEDIITGLSRIKWLFVIARNSSFVYKGKAVDVKQVGRELGVRYVMEGSVRKAGNRLRITGQLVDADSGAHLWADRYDGALEDVFDLQDKITDAVVGIIEPSLRRAEIERARRKRPENLDAYDLVLRALARFASIMPEDIKVAITLLEEAVKLDPNYAIAHAYLSWCMEIRYVRGGFYEEDKLRGVRHARLALVQGGDDATALAVASFVILILDKDIVAAKSGIARAIGLNSSCALALLIGAQVLGWAGDKTLAEEYANRGLRLSPFDPHGFQAYIALGFVRLREQRYIEAASFFSTGVQVNPGFSTIYSMQVAALALAGQIDEAKLIARRLLQLEPGFRINPLEALLVGALLPDVAKRWFDGLRRAGLPE
jgi:adenylate cyclase